MFLSESDHNWIFCSVEDKYSIKRSYSTKKVLRKPKWNFSDNFDWRPFTTAVEKSLESVGDLQTHDPNSLAKHLSDVLIRAAESSRGYKPQNGERHLKSTELPKDIVLALK